ncbi:Calcium-transporting ATPase 2 [Apiospora kogelbergensis]|uniref:Calcium-transporting ATPase 2 n=1 Tax=Apiospora kogelbergensis TaxID=1337665 RepID=UPI003131FC61
MADKHSLAPPTLQVNTHVGQNNDIEDARTPSRLSTVSNPFLTPTNSNPFLTPSNRSRASSVATTAVNTAYSANPEDALRPEPGTEDAFKVENNPFAFSPGQLNKLLDPKSLHAFKALGGLRGIEKGLQTDLQAGLSVDETSARRRITFEEATRNIKHEASSDENSVSAPDAFSDRIRVYGKNVLPAKKATSLWRLMWNAYNDKVILVLTGAAVISLSLGLYETLGRPHPPGSPPSVDWVEGVAICIAIIIVTVVGSLNDWQKERAFVKLNEKKDDREIKVIRSGRSHMINVHDVLVGDVLHLEPGDLIPVDGIFIGGHDLRCDESSATGESDAIRKTGGQLAMDMLENGQSTNNVDPFIISGAKVLEGVGTYVCTSVGVNSSFGKIMMSAKLEKLAVAIAKLGTASAGLLFFVLLFRFVASLPSDNRAPAEKASSFLDILIVAITIIVVAVPEGLPLAVTLALAFATKRLFEGEQSCSCPSITGTLTTNKMTVVAGTFGSTSFNKPETDGINTQTVSQWASGLSPATKEAIVQAVAINSTAFEGEEDGQSTFIGSKTETALLQLCKDHLGMQSLSTTRADEEVVQMMPFDSSKKCMGAVVKLRSGGYRLLVKGASEILLKCCTGKAATTDCVTTNLPTSALTEADVGALRDTITSYARKSLRTISLVYRDFSQWPPAKISTKGGHVDLSTVLEDLVFLGLVGIQDPVRPGVPEAVKKAQYAGVVVRMVTGDNVVTAQAIATECGIYTNGIVMEGPVFRTLSDEAMELTLPRLQVLARSSPEDKRILVMRLKERGETVAVTGDGTNDAPALKAADVGFSMGLSGTEVAKEASSIVLMDDNFASIIVALKWGRAVNDAVQKFLQFQITVNITAVLLAFISAVSDPEMKSVLTAVQLLWVNLIMDTFAALALATDPPTEKILDRPPQPKSAPLITVNMWKMIIGQAIFQLTATLILHYAGPQILGYSEVELDTMVFNTFVWMQIFNEFNNRRLDNKFNIFEGVHRNKFFIGINCIMVGAQIAIVFVGGTAFSITSINGVQWAICILLAFVSLPWAIVVRLFPDMWFDKMSTVCGRPVVITYHALGTCFSRIGQVFGRLKGEKATNADGDVEAPPNAQPPTVIVSDAVIPSIQVGSVGDDERNQN